MITVVSFNRRKRKDGETFLTLTITGGLELVQSQSTGNWRGVVRKCEIPCSFDETIAQTIVGTQLPGTIVRVQSDPYVLTDKNTGEAITLSHRWRYQPEGASVPVDDLVLDDIEEEQAAA